MQPIVLRNPNSHYIHEKAISSFHLALTQMQSISTCPISLTQKLNHSLLTSSHKNKSFISSFGLPNETHASFSSTMYLQNPKNFLHLETKESETKTWIVLRSLNRCSCCYFLTARPRVPNINSCMRQCYPFPALYSGRVYFLVSWHVYMNTDGIIRHFIKSIKSV